MAANQQIGWSVEAKLLNKILKQLEIQNKLLSKIDKNTAPT